VAIIGIETSYGKKTGDFLIIQSLATLAFDYPRRSAFFREELAHFLLLAKEGALDANTTKGSFAGAIGIPQFMPSSYRRFAVDFKKKGKRDLLHDVGDVIGSIANYLNLHGWQRNGPIANKATVSGKAYQTIAKNKVTKPHLTMQQLARYSIKLQKPQALRDKTQKANLMVLERSKDFKEYWIGFQNFYVITRYNHSIHYAMAVYHLSQHIHTLQQGKK